MHPNCWCSPFKAPVRQPQIAPVKPSPLGKRVLVRSPFPLLSVMAGMLIMSPQVLANSQLTANLSQPIDRPELPNRGVPTERRPAGALTPCAKILISSAPQALAKIKWKTSSSQRIDRPELPNRGIPIERKQTGSWDVCWNDESRLSPRLLMADMGFSETTLLQQLEEGLLNLARSIDQQRCLINQ
ncbi:MAG: hypothetical protein QNJ46_26455 [Leptolyngbyaceae cyanobacterium MO_188.B28]|nr:hypothetical protein [Leptolyngbyaceae cyanobacterium MO_188.B28]